VTKKRQSSGIGKNINNATKQQQSTDGDQESSSDKSGDNHPTEKMIVIKAATINRPQGGK